MVKDKNYEIFQFLEVCMCVLIYESLVVSIHIVVMASGVLGIVTSRVLLTKHHC